MRTQNQKLKTQKGREKSLQLMASLQESHGHGEQSDLSLRMTLQRERDSSKKRVCKLMLRQV